MNTDTKDLVLLAIRLQNKATVNLQKMASAVECSELDVLHALVLLDVEGKIGVKLPKTFTIASTGNNYEPDGVQTESVADVTEEVEGRATSCPSDEWEW